MKRKLSELSENHSIRKSKRAKLEDSEIIDLYISFDNLNINMSKQIEANNEESTIVKMTADVINTDDAMNKGWKRNCSEDGKTLSYECNNCKENFPAGQEGMSDLTRHIK